MSTLAGHHDKKGGCDMGKRFREIAVLLVVCLVAVGGCARGRRGGLRGLAERAPGETITEEELEALGINPELSARGMVFADTSKLQDVYFDFDRSDIKPDTRRILAENAEWLRKHRAVKVQIEGHCDERGTVEYNLALGQRRAASVRKYLVALGINPGKVFTISYGEEQPVDPRHSESAWAENRRAHFKIKAR